MSEQLPKPARRASWLLRQLLQRGTPCAIAWSAGKDSSVAANLVLTTAAALRRAGHRLAPIVVLHADTGVENPEVWQHARSELDKMRAFAKKHDIDLRVAISHPPLAAQWPVRVIGGSALPTFPSANSRDCSVDLKIKPMARLRKQWLKALGEHEATRHPPVTVVATRFDESAERAKRMAARGDSAEQIRQGEDGALYLTPLANWTSSDVWEYLAQARNAQIPAYSDFADTFRLYADAAGTTCAVVGDDITASLKHSRACGSRFGCAICEAVSSDQSMENMIEQDPAYHYMRGLNRLQRFMAATQYDWSRRNWLGRTIDEAGYVAINPDLYSPGMLETLLRYALTIDVEEQIAAQAAGLPAPRFSLVNAQQLVAIDAEWSRQGVARPFHALKLYRDIYLRGVRHPVPLVPTVARTPIPTPRYLYVGSDWDEDRAWQFTGLRNPLLEAQASDWGQSGCLGATKTLANGRTVLDLPADTFYDIDPEGIELLLAFEMDRLIEVYHDNCAYRTTAGYHYYASAGLLTLSHGQARATDEILRRTAFKERHALVGEYNIAPLLSRTISATEHTARTGLSSTPEEAQLSLLAPLDTAQALVAQQSAHSPDITKVAARKMPPLRERP